MRKERINEIENCLNNTKKGEWIYFNDLKSGFISCKIDEENIENIFGGYFCEGMIPDKSKDAEFCIKAHNDFIPELLHAVKRLKKKLKVEKRKRKLLKGNDNVSNNNVNS